MHHPPLLLPPVRPIYHTVTPTNNHIAMYTVDITTTITIAIASGCSPVTITVIISIVSLLASPPLLYRYLLLAFLFYRYLLLAFLLYRY